MTGTEGSIKYLLGGYLSAVPMLPFYQTVTLPDQTGGRYAVLQLHNSSSMVVRNKGFQCG